MMMNKFGVLCFVTLYLQSITAQCIRNTLIEGPCEGVPSLPRPLSTISPLSGCLNLPTFSESLAAIQSSSGLSQWAFSMLSPISPLSMSCLNGFGPSALAASNGAGLFTTSFSPIAPTGLFINSENYFDGTVSVAGQVPFLGSIAIQGALPSAGTGSIVYGCGNGDIYILSEDVTDSCCDYTSPFDLIDFSLYGYDRSCPCYGCSSRYY